MDFVLLKDFNNFQIIIILKKRILVSGSSVFFRKIVKKLVLLVFLKLSQNSQENTSTRVFF